MATKTVTLRANRDILVEWTKLPADANTAWSKLVDPVDSNDGSVTALKSLVNGQKLRVALDALPLGLGASTSIVLRVAHLSDGTIEADSSFTANLYANGFLLDSVAAAIFPVGGYVPVELTSAAWKVTSPTTGLEVEFVSKITPTDPPSLPAPKIFVTALELVVNYTLAVGFFDPIEAPVTVYTVIA